MGIIWRGERRGLVHPLDKGNAKMLASRHVVGIERRDAAFESTRL